MLSQKPKVGVQMGHLFSQLRSNALASLSQQIVQKRYLSSQSLNFVCVIFICCPWLTFLSKVLKAIASSCFTGPITMIESKLCARNMSVS